MKVWFDILTPKQLIFLTKFGDYLKTQGVQCVYTSRIYSEVTTLAELHGIDLIYCGNYGKTNNEKLKNSIQRMATLQDIVENEKPDVAINCCSPDACRVAYGLGIPLFLLNDTPWAEITNKLTMPLAKRIWIPMIYKKNIFSKFCVSDSIIKHYECLDAFVTSSRKSIGELPIKEKYVLFRTPESFSTYIDNDLDIITMLQIVKSQVPYKIMVLCRYIEQYNEIKALNEPQIIPTMMKYDGKMLYENAEIFIGAGGTMSVESALYGTPTIVYDVLKKQQAIDWMESKNIILRVKTTSQLKSKIKYAVEHKNAFKLRANDIRAEMRVPFNYFYDDIRQELGLE